MINNFLKDLEFLPPGALDSQAPGVLYGDIERQQHRGNGGDDGSASR